MLVDAAPADDCILFVSSLFRLFIYSFRFDESSCFECVSSRCTVFLATLLILAKIDSKRLPLTHSFISMAFVAFVAIRMIFQLGNALEIAKKTPENVSFAERSNIYIIELNWRQIMLCEAVVGAADACDSR